MFIISEGYDFFVYCVHIIHVCFEKGVRVLVYFVVFGIWMLEFGVLLGLNRCDGVVLVA